MKKTYSLQAVFILAVLAPFFVKAQSASNGGSIFNEGTGYRRWSIGVNGGALAPVAIIGGSNDFTKWKASAGYGAYVKWQILHALGLRADYIGGKLTGDNSRNLGNDEAPNRKYSSFETKLKWSASLSAVVNVATINWLYRKNAVQIYVSAGGGLAGYSPRVELPGGDLKEYKPSGNIQEFIVPVGAGLKFKLSEIVNLDLGYTMHFVDGDNLDGYNYGRGKDKYSYGYGGLEFSLGRRNRPQLAWQNPARVMYDDLAAQKATLTQELAASREANAVLKADMDKLKADDDGDGVSNIFDKCPGTQAGAKVDGSGCDLPKPPPPPAVTQVTITEDDRRLVKDAIQNLEFETGRSSIKPSSYPSLNRVAEMLKNKGFSLKLGGHTDNVGNAQKNMALSKDRAESVKQYLVSQGANPSRIEAVGYGAGQPIASNKTAAGRQKNRRVEFTLY
ncbi:OmpA family protein [Chitinophaga tropicalis]|uniref:OmpA family protein n=1 Tax=Chitinophaga tropicalis TaxID=2683588 RepID=A0A7K1UBJ3_9BACT|nr:OmpA family protein [Chitinophaga tropicalis]MVT11648.1 OmpA family protein [Chitinophaga tropicalis]